jgi:predicted Rossmann fold flavoprotein
VHRAVRRIPPSSLLQYKKEGDNRSVSRDDERNQAVPDTVVIVGAGAAGLATAIFARRANPPEGVVLLEGARKPGAKILVSGGSRCNVTNAVVHETDFWGGKRTIVRQVLRAFPPDRTVDLFRDLEVSLHEEADGKLFPDTNRARDVLEALLRGAGDAGVDLRAGVRVHDVSRVDGRFVVATSSGDINASRVVLATGGQSLPKTGSDGAGYEIARALGHTIVPRTPALAPLVLDPDSPYSIHRHLSGVAVNGEIAIWIEGSVAVRLAGALLWTHFGVSGPVALNASRHWARARIEQRGVRLTLSYYPGRTFDDVDEHLRAVGSAGHYPRTVRTQLASDLPDSVVRAILDMLAIPVDRSVAELARDDRRRVVHALTEWPLPVSDTRGYNFAEVTAGGVALDEIDPSTMESRRCPGLYLVGEILDVDGRIGGFNFQWAWSSAFVAGRALATRA